MQSTIICDFVGGCGSRICLLLGIGLGGLEGLNGPHVPVEVRVNFIRHGFMFWFCMQCVCVCVCVCVGGDES